MRGLLMPGRIIRCAVDLQQDKARRIILLLDEIKAGNAGLFQAAAGIFNGGCLECLDLIRFDMGKNMDYIHGSLLGLKGKHLNELMMLF